MGEIANIVKPETILAWQRRLEREKWDYSERRENKPGRPRKPADVVALVCRMGRENTWGKGGEPAARSGGSGARSHSPYSRPPETADLRIQGAQRNSVDFRRFRYV